MYVEFFFFRLVFEVFTGNPTGLVNLEDRKLMFYSVDREWSYEWWCGNLSILLNLSNNEQAKYSASEFFRAKISAQFYLQTLNPTTYKDIKLITQKL